MSGEDVLSSISSAGLPSPPSLEAATAMVSGAVAGEPIEPRPEPSPSFPAATADTTPAAAALSSARTTTSRLGSISTSPSDRLITFIPSATAWSIAFAISGALPSGP